MSVIGSDGGVVGVFGHAGATRLAFAGALALGHRGREAAIIAARGERVQRTLLVADEAAGLPAELDTASRLAVASVAPRRRTGGRSTVPVVAQTVLGPLGVTTTGRLVNAPSLERDLLASGSVLTQGSDAELLLHLVAQSSQRTLVNRLVDALLQARGGFAVLVAAPGRLVAVRDPLGLRPLSLGRRGTAVLAATESRAIARMGGSEAREVEPGEMVILDSDGITSLFPFPRSQPRPCLRELVTLSAADSVCCGMSGFEVRKAVGARLAAESPVGADVVTSLSAANDPVALGFAERTGLGFVPDLVDLGPRGGATLAQREVLVTATEPVVRGKRIVLVHDTVGPEVPWSGVVRALTRAGAREIHLRIGGPPTRFPCLYGVALLPPTTVGGGDRRPDELAAELEVASVGWLELNPLREAVQSPVDNACDGCYSGRYPLEHDDPDQPQLTLFDA